MIFIFIFIALSRACTWQDEDGHLYNYTTLDKPHGWQVKGSDKGE